MDVDARLTTDSTGSGRPRIRHSRFQAAHDSGEALKICVLDDYQDVATSMGDWASIGRTLELDAVIDHVQDENDLAALLEPYEILVAMRERTQLRARLLDRLPNLRMIVTTGQTNAAIDVLHARDRGIPVTATRSTRNSTCEMAWALILAVARNVPTEDREIRNGHWQRTIGLDLAGKTIGIVGLGRQGFLMAGVAHAFRMNVIAWSTNLTVERAEEARATRVDKDELFRLSDVVTIQVLYSPRTHHLVGKHELELMKPTAILVNTARGPIVDESALVDVLRERRIAGAGLDVYDAEPLPADHPFLSLPNTVLTPHLGYVTRGMYEVFYRDIVENIAAFLEGRLLRADADQLLHGRAR